MAHRDPPKYRSWNVSALGLKTETPENDLSYKDQQRPRRDSWSPPRRGRATRGRGTWGIDNRPQSRRRNTMPNSTQNYNHHAENYESNDYNRLEGNPILEEPRNLSPSVNDHHDLKIMENNDNYYKDESSLNRRKCSSDNIYRPPKSRSTSYNEDWKSNSSIDDGSQSRGTYSNGTSKKYEPDSYKVQWDSWEREPINNEPNQMWPHDKFESIENETVFVTDLKDKKDASTQVEPSDIRNETLETINNDIAIFSEYKPPEDSEQSVTNAEFPKEITVKVSELTLKDSDIDKPESAKSEVTPEISPVTPLTPVTPVTPVAPVAPVTPVTPVAPVTPVTPKDEELLPMLINLDEDDNADKQTIQPKISEDILALDWPSYQQTLWEEECNKLTMSRPIKMSSPRKLDTILKDFDSLL